MELKESRNVTYRVRTRKDETEYKSSEGYSLAFGSGGVLSIHKSEEWGKMGQAIKILSPGFWEEIVYAE